MNTITLTIPHLTPEAFLEICEANQDIRIERESTGEVILMSPTTAWSGKQNFSLAAQLGAWIDRTGLGIGFDSSTGFTLPNGAVRSPDVAWISTERWESLTEEQQQQFTSISPDFVVELRSLSDSLETLRKKMQEYMANGVRLGWLINPKNKQVEIYRLGQNVQILDNPAMVFGEDILPGFELNMSKVW